MAKLAGDTVTTDSAKYLTELHQILNQHFNLAEIRTLCLDLNVDYESVAGEEKPSRIRELLLGLGRNGRLPELVLIAQQQRPHVEWPLVPDDLELPEALETAISPNQYHIYGDKIQGDKFAGDKIGRDKNVVGDVFGQAAVAVGERAQATINQYGDIIIRADNFEDLPPAPGEPPYKGLAYFATKDKDIFFGREKLSDELADRLQTTHFLAIMGASGSGKSSLLRAGIIPRLEERNWRIHIIKLGIHPLAALATSLTRDDLDPVGTDAIGKALATDATTLHKTAEKLVARAHAERLLLAVDQFEELFTQCKNPQEQQAFVDNLVSAAQAQGAVTVLLNLRADFYGRVSQFHNLPDLISQQQVYIKPMAEEDLVRAIVEPAKRGGWQFVEGLVEQFVADLGNEPGRLPLLSHALLATWERRRGVVMTLGGYREAGGVKTAIAQTAEATYAALTASEKLIAKRIFLRLTELGKGTEDTRRRVHQVEMGEDTAVQAVTQRLTAARLITTTQDGIDVAHEALIREWPRLREWLDADREGLIIHRRLTDAEREWRHNGQEPSLLYSGFRLNEAEQWIQENADVLNELEQTFFIASITERQRREIVEEAKRQRELKQVQALAEEQRQRVEIEQKRSALFRRALIVGSMLLLLLLVAVIFARIQTNTANVQANIRATAVVEAIASAHLAATREQEAIISGRQALGLSLAAQAPALAEEQADQDDELAILLALEAQRLNIETGNTINKVVDRTLRSLLTQEFLSYPLEGNHSAVNATAFSPNGDAIAFTDVNDTLWYWDISSTYHESVALTESIGGESILTFSSDGNLLASGDKNGIVRLWDIQNLSNKPIIIEENTSTIASISFDPNGDKLAIGTIDGQLFIWDISESYDIPKLVFIRQGHFGWVNNSVNAVAFTLDGQTLASGSTDGTVKLWQVANPNALPITLELPEKAWVLDIAFSSDENSIVIASQDVPSVSPLELDNLPGTVWIWNFSNNDKSSVALEQNDWAVKSLGFSPDGETLALVQLS